MGCFHAVLFLLIEIDSISFCEESNALIAGNESGYVEQLQFGQSSIEVISMTNPSLSICVSNKERLLFCLTTSHLIQVK